MRKNLFFDLLAVTCVYLGLCVILDGRLRISWPLFSVWAVAVGLQLCFSSSKKDRD